MTVNAVKEAIADPTDTIYPKRRGIDFYHRYKEDLALFAEMGFQSTTLIDCMDEIISNRRRNWSQMSRGIAFLSKCRSRNNAAFRNQTDRDTFSL